MATHILRYVSPPKAYSLTPPILPYSGKVERWTIYEQIQDHSREDLRQQGISEYRVEMETQVANEDDLAKAISDAHLIASQLENLWIYSAARPFYYMRVTLLLMEGPDGWKGNVKEVRQAIRRDGGARVLGDIHLQSQNWETPPFLPLETALKARAAYLINGPTLQQVIDLHVAAFKHSGQPKHVLLASALEIAGSYYPDSTGNFTRVARNSGLQQLISDAGLDRDITQTIEWLFNTANTRREIRHAWNQQTSSLHPQLTLQEGEDFVRNADLVLRAFVCKQLGLPIVVYRGQL